MNSIKLERQLKLEQLIADVARKFVMVNEVTDALNEALEKIGKFGNASRAYLFRIDRDNEVMNNTFEWCEEGVNPEIENLQGLPLSIFPWWMNKLSKGEIIDIHDVSALGPEAASEKEILQSQDILSVLVLPVSISGELYGFIGFDNTRTLGEWSEEDLSILQVTRELFSNAIARMKSEQKLKMTNEELSRTVDQLKRTQSQLVRQEQMVAIGQLAAGVAHEINNPLSFILSNQGTLREYAEELIKTLDMGAEFITNNLEATDLDKLKRDMEQFATRIRESDLDFIKKDIGETLKDIDIGIHRVSKIVKGLRFFSHGGNSHPEIYNIVEGLENTLIVAGSRLRETAEVITEIEDSIPLIRCHGSQINQVFMNIIMNAVDAFDAIEDGRSPAIHIVVRSNDKDVVCTIEDNGCGMDEKTADQIFNPFFTTKPIGSGTGLGMSIAYDAMKENKGTITVDTQLGKGTKFTLTLPMTEP